MYFENQKVLGGILIFATLLEFDMIFMKRTISDTASITIKKLLILLRRKGFKNFYEKTIW